MRDPLLGATRSGNPALAERHAAGFGTRYRPK